MLSINVSELIWTIINFFLLYFLLKRFLYTPVIRFMDERQARMDAKLRKEQEALNEAKENDERLEAEKQKSREEAKRILSESAAKREQQHAEAMKAAREQAADVRKQGVAGLDERREKTEAKLKSSTQELAGLLAGRLLGGE